MLSVVAFKWKPFPGYRSTFGPEAVNTLASMVKRNYGEHQMICCTDDPTGIDPSITIVPLWDTYADVKSPHGGHNPSCYRRLRAFSPEARDWFGERFVWMDLDTVITGDLRPIFDRPEPFVIWGQTDQPKSWYNGSLVLMTAGARKQVWEEFDPKTTPAKAKAAGCFGSDQGAISYILKGGEATFGQQDGVYSYRVHLKPKGGALPKGARIVNWHGHVDPWSYSVQHLAWVKEHYR